MLATQLSAGTIAGRWTIQPLAIVVAVAGAAWYLRAAGRQTDWPRRRTVWFGIGILLWLAVCCGPAEHYDRSVYWVWVSQALTLLLIVPLPLMLGQPGELVRLPGFVDRLGSPLLGPALIPVVCVAALFGPVPGWSVEFPAFGWLVQLLMLSIGAVIMLPLVAARDTATSIAVGIAVAVGFVELLIDAVPGIVLRLSTHPATSFFDHRIPLSGAPPWLHDQQIGGGVLWCVAELLDLPFLVLIFRRWVRADAREAAVVDAQLEEQALTSDDDTPWFINDPRLKDRLR